jgi:hypothetical protein
MNFARLMWGFIILISIVTSLEVIFPKMSDLWTIYWIIWAISSTLALFPAWRFGYSLKDYEPLYLK